MADITPSDITLADPRGPQIYNHTGAFELAAGAIAIGFTADSTAGRQGLFSKDASYYGDGGHLTVWLQHGKIVARLQSEDASHTVSGGTIRAGESADLAVSFGPGGLMLYVDGERVDSDPYDGGLVGNREPIVLGASQWASSVGTADDLIDTFRGTIDAFRVFDEQLDGDAIRALTVGDAPAEPTAPEGPSAPDTPSEPAMPAPELSTPDAAAFTVQTFEAEDFDATQGVGVFTQGGNRQIGSTQDGEWVRYDAVDFGDDPSASQTLGLKLSSGSGGGTLEVRLGSPDGALAVSYATGSTGGWASYDMVDLDLGSLTGEQDLFFVFRGNARSIMDIDTFTLTTGTAGGMVDPDPEPATPDVELPMPDAEPDAPPTEPENRAPFVVVPDTGQALPEGETRTIDVAHLFRDPDNEALTYSLEDAPDFVSIDGTVLTISPGFDDAGTYEVGVVASDGRLSSGPASVVYEIADAAPPQPEPVPEPPAPQPEPSADGRSVRLDAGADVLTENADGSFTWAPGVTLTGYQRDGSIADVVFSTQFSDHGFGVAGEGSRWDGQIDFYDVNGGESERIVIDFDAPVDDLTLTVGMLGAREGRLGETGEWVARGADGSVVGTGLIGAEFSALGDGVKEGDSYGIYPIDIGIDDVAALELSATQFGYGEGESQTRNYGENSSDYNVMAIDFTTDALFV